MSDIVIPKEFIEQGEKILSLFGWNFIAAVAILIIGQIISKFIVHICRKILTKSQIDQTVIGFACKLIYTVLMVIVLLSSLSKLGVQTTSFLAILGSAGLAIGLALQGSLSNFSAGVLLLVLRPFKIGDFIECAGVAGVVEEMHMLNTQLKTPDNKTIFIPNASISSGNLINYSTKDTRRIDLVIGVSYDDDLSLVKSTLKKIILDESRVLKDIETQIAVAELADSSVNLVVRPWVKSADYWGVKFDLLEKIKIEFDSKGICIPYPQQDIHIKKEA
ncbi:MAG: mechanosensitive ion channel protein [Candidatus Cloacimonadota bacterium]|nr:MAG: mechanosensitive ion channel protein [Candidatus Cloacimonadota bacterium]